jgi:hypothetical protein
MPPNEIFLSHSSQDRDFALIVAATLRSHGLPVWYSPTNIVGAQQWHDEIGAALERCDWFVVILSPNSITSKWVKRELVYALEDDRFENRIVPLRYLDCKEKLLSWTLSQLQIVDFTASHDDGFIQLLRIWGIGYNGRLQPI